MKRTVTLYTRIVFEYIMLTKCSYETSLSNTSNTGNVYYKIQNLILRIYFSDEAFSELA